MTVQEVTEKIVKRAEGQDAIGNSIKFQFDEGVVHIDGKGEGNEITNDDKDADATVKVSLDDLNSLLTGDLNPMGAFMSGKIKIDGDMGVAMKLQKLF